MQEKTNEHNPEYQEPGTQEPIIPENDVVDATTSKDEASAQGWGATASFDSPEATSHRPAKHVWSTSEWLRGSKGAWGTERVEFALDSVDASDFEKMTTRAQYARDPWQRMPSPRRPEAYGTIHELFAKMKRVICEQTRLSNPDCTLLAALALSTWFQDFLPLAPGLVITGFPDEGERVLSALRSICYHPILVSGLTTSVLNNMRWELNPTLLISEPCLSKPMAALLSSSTSRGSLARRKQDGGWNGAFDFYGSKVIYVADEPPRNSMLRHCIQINASPEHGFQSPYVPPMSEGATLEIQNQLLGYRVACAGRVFKSEFCPSGLSPEISAIASALGSCILDAPQLRDELVSVLKPVAEQQIDARTDELTMLSIGALFFLCHQGKDKIRVGEIAAEVNRRQKARGERLQYNPEKVGRRLRKVGLPSRRLGAAGNGYLMDRVTLVRIHEMADEYGCGSSTGNIENLHCLLCPQTECLMEDVYH